MFFLRRDLGEVFSLFSRWKPCFKFSESRLDFLPTFKNKVLIVYRRKRKKKVLILNRRKRKLPGRSTEYFVVACIVGCTCFDPEDQKKTLNLKRQPEEKEYYFIFLQTDNLSVALINTSIAIASIGSSCSISSKTSLAL